MIFLRIADRLHLGMRFVVLFGSISGVVGNRGQTDYAAANDALDALARTHDGHNGCRVLSIDWGPWAGGGMVSPELEREYERRGIGLVDPDDGVMALLHEIGAGAGHFASATQQHHVATGLFEIQLQRRSQMIQALPAVVRQRLHGAAVESPIRLDAWTADGRPLAAVQHLGVDRRRIRGARHDPVERIDTKILEVVFELDDRDGLLPGLRVTSYIEY